MTYDIIVLILIREVILKKKYKARRLNQYFSPLMKKHPEYYEQSWEIMDDYMTRYQKEFSLEMEPVHQTLIREWLFQKEKIEKYGGYISPELHDYKIKFSLCICSKNEKYNEAISLLYGECLKGNKHITQRSNANN